MRREVRALRDKAIDSLVLAIELFNRPTERGRTTAVLIQCDHAFEMLLKAAIRHRGGRLAKGDDTYTIGFRACVTTCLTDPAIRCLTPEQAITLHAINGWRDAAQHYLLELSEQQLYLASQGAVTLFDDLLDSVFGDRLAVHVPTRVLPVSTEPPKDLDLLIDNEMDMVRELIAPGLRRLSDARSRLRALAILEAATAGREEPPTGGELDGQIAALRSGADWRTLFPGVAGLQLRTSGSGLSFSLRISKKEGVPVQLVTEGSATTPVVAVKRVNELDFYQFGLKSLSQHLAFPIGPNKLRAVLDHLGMRSDPKYFKVVQIDRSKFPRYSQDALRELQQELPTLDIDAIWAAHQGALRRARSG